MSNYYTKTEVVNDQFITTSVKETVESVKPILKSDVEYKVIKTGAYGNITIADANGLEYVCHNPFSKYFSKLEDKRIADKTIIAEGKFTCIYIKDITFNLTGEQMSRLHHDLYCPVADKQHWIDIPSDWK